MCLNKRGGGGTTDNININKRGEGGANNRVGGLKIVLNEKW